MDFVEISPMKLSKSAEKLGKYLHRLKAGKAEKITADHVHRIIHKLQKKADRVRNQMDQKKERLRHKLKIVGTQMERANWLLGEIGSEVNVNDSNVDTENG